MTNQPSFLLSNPKPQEKARLYNGRRLFVLEGKVRVSSINGWVDNPRIELAKKQVQSIVGNRELTQAEVFDLMKNDPEVKLKVLRDDIIKNGLREPLTLSFNGKLLDGNRRFFAIKYALETLPLSDPNRQELEIVDAYVLKEMATLEDEQNVLVEENFSASLKIEWPDYVKAIKVIEAYEAGLNVADLSSKFSWSKQKINETLRIRELTEEFMTLAMDTPDLEDEYGGGFGLSAQEAETIVAKNYQFFNEAQKSFFNALKTDFEFKIQFFKWIYENKFSSYQEVRIAHSAWKHPEAKSVLMHSDPSAAKSAKAIIDYDKRVVQITDNSISKIEDFTSFLFGMTATQINLLPENTRNKLEQALRLVTKMSKAASE